MDELNEGKMLYAAIKVMDPNTNLPKIVFINWVCQLYNKVIFDYNNLYQWVKPVTIYIIYACPSSGQNAKWIYTLEAYNSIVVVKINIEIVVEPD